MKILIIGALPQSLLNFRGQLIKDIHTKGHEIIAMAAPAEQNTIDQIEELGCRYQSFPIQRNGLNPLSDIKTLFALIKIIKKEQPDIVFSYTVKPIVWGGIAARFFSKAKFYGLITGLGFAFQQQQKNRKLINFIVTNLYKQALSKATAVIFQNPDNQHVFIENGIIPLEKTFRVNGSGVDTKHFVKSPLPITSSTTFLTIARLLGDKGIIEFYQAAKLVKTRYPNTHFQILGPADPSPDGIKLSEVMKWHDDKEITYLGETDDVRPFINNCHIFVLPSYHEGMPRTVLEAMATGRPILTTNVPGCKETVDDGLNGFLVEKQNYQSLADKMIYLLDNQDSWNSMAEHSYDKVIKSFTIEQVNQHLLHILKL